MLNVRFFIFFLIKICTNKFVDFFLNFAIFLLKCKFSDFNQKFWSLFIFHFFGLGTFLGRFLHLEWENIALWISVYHPNNLLSHTVRPFLIVPEIRNIFFRYSVIIFGIFRFSGKDKERPDDRKIFKLEKNQRRKYIRYRRTYTKSNFLQVEYRTVKSHLSTYRWRIWFDFENIRNEKRFQSLVKCNWSEFLSKKHFFNFFRQILESWK